MIQVKSLLRSTLVSVFLVGLSLNTFARSTEAFQKRFQIIRNNEGKLIGIKDRTIPVRFQVAPYLKMIKEQLKNEQALISQKGNYNENILNLLREDLENEYVDNAERVRQEQIVVKSLNELSKLNVDEVFAHPVVNEVVSLYESKMGDVLLKLDPTMLAVTNDPSYFYKKNVTYQVVRWGLDFARKRLSNMPVLNTASYVMVQVEKLITERRTFHQNMLLHYLEMFKAEDLGLTKEEVDLVWSSIYESRIAWFNFIESNNAKATWAKYGINKFYQSFRLGSDVLRTNAGTYSSLDERMNFAFQRVSLNGENLAINLFDKEGMFFNRPAVAFNFNKPTQIARKRVVLSLAQLGLSFVPLNATLKDFATNFMKSFYEKQRLTEGALFGYLESYGLESEKQMLSKQYMNPFETNLML